MKLGNTLRTSMKSAPMGRRLGSYGQVRRFGQGLADFDENGVWRSNDDYFSSAMEEIQDQYAEDAPPSIGPLPQDAGNAYPWYDPTVVFAPSAPPASPAPSVPPAPPAPPTSALLGGKTPLIVGAIGAAIALALAWSRKPVPSPTPTPTFRSQATRMR